MTIAATPQLSLESFLVQLETKPASEFIQGEVIQKPRPRGKHSRLQFQLAKWLDLQLEPNELGSVFTELRCTFAP